ncbi:MAG TPA: hypothetical protein VF803_01835, partial [Candidatus Paceibacterota bacterium]
MVRVVQESKLRARRRRRRAVLVIISGVLAAAALIGLVFLLRAPFMRIQTIAISGNSTVATADIEARVRQDIAGSWLWVIPKDDILLYPTTQIMRDVQSTFPPLSSVSVRAATFSSIAVAVSEYQPDALWCGAQAPASFANASSSAPNESSCYFMDRDGLVYAPAPQFSGNSYTPFYGTLAGGGLPAQAVAQLPQQFLSPQDFHALDALVVALSQKVSGDSSNPSGASADTVRAVEINSDDDVMVHFADGFLLKFALHDDP